MIGRVGSMVSSCTCASQSSRTATWREGVRCGSEAAAIAAVLPSEGAAPRRACQVSVDADIGHAHHAGEELDLLLAEGGELLDGVGPGERAARFEALRHRGVADGGV